MGLQFISHMGIQKLIVKSDSQTIVTMLNFSDTDLSYHVAILAYIKYLYLGFPIVEFRNIPHKANSVTHTSTRFCENVDDP